MPYNYSKLRGRIREICGTQEAFAQKIGMSESTLSLKLNNRAEWSQEEMWKVMKVINEPDELVSEYFFCRDSLEI